MVDMSTRLSPHFTLHELCKSMVADRLDIANVPGDAEIAMLERVCEFILEPVRVNFGTPFSPNSGFRCLALNRALLSDDDSQHRKGEAVDFEIPGKDNLMLAHWCRGNLAFDQLILEMYTPGVPNSGWVHCSYVAQTGTRRNRHKVGTIIKGVGYVNGLPSKWSPHDRAAYR